MRPVTKDLSDAISEIASTDIPAPVAHHVRRLFLDYLGGVIASSTSHAADAVRSHVRKFSGEGDATAFGLGQADALSAAFLNGFYAHGMEIDDGYTPGSVHPSCVSFPAVVAEAQTSGASVETMIRGAAVALEVTCRLAEAGHPATWARHFHNTPLTGVMGATAGLAAMKRFDSAMTQGAFGIAASHAGGLFEFLGNDAEVKRVHPGKASRDAIVAADLASRGITGPRSAFEGPHGYIRAFAGDDFDVDALLNGFGSEWRMMRTYVKPYPCCRHLHGPIDAALELREKLGPEIEAIDSIKIETYSVATRHDKRDVQSLLDAQMSLPFAVATALVNGFPRLTEFDKSNRESGRIRELSAKIEVVLADDLDAMYPRARPARLIVTMNDASTHQLTVHNPYGEPDNPLSDEAISLKFRGLAEPVIGEQLVAEVDSEVWNLADLDIIRRVDGALREQIQRLDMVA